MLLKQEPAIQAQEKPKENYVPKFWDSVVIGLITIAAIANADAFAAISALHYVIYLAPAVLVALWFRYPSCRDMDRKPDAKFVWLMLVSLLMPAALSQMHAYQYLVFMGWGFLPFAFPVRMRPTIVATLLIVLSICQIGLSAENGFSFKSLNAASLSSGSAAVTHTLPALFGLLLGVFVKKRQFKYVLLCIAMISLAGKRSILMSSTLGVGTMLVCEFLFPPAEKSNDKRVHYILLVPITVGFCVLAAYMPRIYEMIAAHTGLNINVMTSGRYAGQALAYKAAGESDMMRLLFGRGLGQVDAYALIGFSNVTTLIHNDYLRLAIDLGLVPALVYVFSYLRLIGGGSLGIYLAVYLECAWLTENVLINVMFQTLLCLILASVVYQTTEKKAAKIREPLIRVPA